jgi:hypothetical protein
MSLMKTRGLKVGLHDLDLRQLGHTKNFLNNGHKARDFILIFLLKKLTILLRTAIVFVGVLLIGWLLHGFNTPIIVCIGTLVVCCYLFLVGSGGIPLASVWVVSLMSVAAIKQLWLRDLPRPAFQYIPLLILANWLLALAVVWQIGKVSDVFRQSYLYPDRVFWGLACLVTSGLAMGWRLYPETVLLLTELKRQ